MDWVVIFRKDSYDVYRHGLTCLFNSVDAKLEVRTTGRCG